MAKDKPQAKQAFEGELRLQYLHVEFSGDSEAVKKFVDELMKSFGGPLREALSGLDLNDGDTE